MIAFGELNVLVISHHVRPAGQLHTYYSTKTNVAAS